MFAEEALAPLGGFEEGAEGGFGVAVEAAGDVALQERPAAVLDLAEQGLDQGDVVRAVAGAFADRAGEAGRQPTWRKL